MNESTSEQNIFTQEKAQARAEAFLREKYFSCDKVVFNSCEVLEDQWPPIYIFNGLLIQKARALMDIIARDRKNNTYKFVIKISSKNGGVLDYYLK